MASTTAIGIDLGTTNSCVGVVRNGRVEIIANDMGPRTTPSVVAFTDAERLVGDAAKEQISWNAKNTIFDAKWLIGRNFSDPSVQKKIEHWTFNVVEDSSSGSPQFEVQHLNKSKTFTPEEISSLVLKNIKKIA